MRRKLLGTGTGKAIRKLDSFVAQYEIQTVGGGTHQELWVPAGELAEFNCHIVGPLEVVKSYYGDRFAGAVDPEFGLPVGVAQIALQLGLPAVR